MYSSIKIILKGLFLIVWLPIMIMVSPLYALIVLFYEDNFESWLESFKDVWLSVALLK